MKEVNEENDTQRKNEENSTVEEDNIEEFTEVSDKVVSEEQVKDKVPASINEDHNMEDIIEEDASIIEDQNMEEIKEAPIEATSKKISKDEPVSELIVKDINEKVSREYFASQEEEEEGVQEEGLKHMTINIEVMHRDCSQVARD